MVNHYMQKKDKIQNRKGLREIILKRNSLGEQFMDALSSCLRYDRFIKVIDLQANLIPDSALKSLVKNSLRENHSLVSLSVGKNPGLSEKTRKQIALCLLKNIESFKQNGIEIKEEWIRQSDLSFKIPQRILDNLGIQQKSLEKSTNNDYTTQTTHQDRHSRSNSQRQKSTGRKASRSTKSRNKKAAAQTTITTQEQQQNMDSASFNKMIVSHEKRSNTAKKILSSRGKGSSRRKSTKPMKNNYFLNQSSEQPSIILKKNDAKIKVHKSKDAQNLQIQHNK